MPIRRSQKKRNAEPRQKQNHRRLVIDTMVNPGSSAHRHQARSKADPARPHHRMVTLAQSSPGDRSACAPQSKTATVMLGHKACRDDFAVAYHRVPRLFAALALGRADGRYTKMLRAIARLDLLILDDWGPEPLDADQRRDLLEIVEDRYEARSIIVTSQLPVDRWYEIIGNPTIADAILDRLVHNAYRIELKGESLRKQKQTAQDQPVS